MSLKCEKQSFSYLSAVAQAKGQSIVECRFPGEIVTVLAVNTAVSLISADAADGEISYRGKVILTVVYEDGEKKICRSERGMEFSHTVRDERCTPASRPVVRLYAENVRSRREGSGLYISVIIGSDITLYAEQSADFVSGGEEICVKKESVRGIGAELFDGEGDADDEFDTEYVGDILMHGEKVNITDITSGDGVVSVSGEINLNICALKGEQPISFERLIPFKVESACDKSSSGLKCDAAVFVERAEISAEADEEKGRCRMRAEFTLRVSGAVYSESELNVVSDAYSLKNKLNITREKFTCEALSDCVRFTERVSGKASIDGSMDFSDSLSCVLLPSAFAEIVKGERGERVEGILSAVLILSGSDGTRKSRKVELPFSAPFAFALPGNKKVSAMPCGVSVRQRKEGEAEVEATLKFTVTAWNEVCSEYISDISAGDELQKNDSAISIYMPDEGISLWELAKFLKIPPDEVERTNPDLSFPLKGTERIFIYRQKNE